jgi:hypothetical protein
MGNLFSRPKPAPPPPPAVEENIVQQEEVVAAEEQETGRRVKARARARGRGTGRTRRANLMAPGVVAGDTSRDVLKNVLGAGRNPRG